MQAERRLQTLQVMGGFGRARVRWRGIFLLLFLAFLPSTLLAADRDYYEILGVPRDADAARIKQGYREQARKHHPDVNPGDEGAERRFKDVQQAYAVLSDPAQRARYDRLGKEGLGGPTGFSSPGAPSDLGLREDDLPYGRPTWQQWWRAQRIGSSDGETLKIELGPGATRGNATLRLYRARSDAGASVPRHELEIPIATLEAIFHSATDSAFGVGSPNGNGIIRATFHGLRFQDGLKLQFWKMGGAVGHGARAAEISVGEAGRELHFRYRPLTPTPGGGYFALPGPSEASPPVPVYVLSHRLANGKVYVASAVDVHSVGEGTEVIAVDPAWLREISAKNFDGLVEKRVSRPPELSDAELDGLSGTTQPLRVTWRDRTLPPERRLAELRVVVRAVEARTAGRGENVPIPENLNPLRAHLPLLADLGEPLARHRAVQSHAGAESSHPSEVVENAERLREAVTLDSEGARARALESWLGGLRRDLQGAVRLSGGEAAKHGSPRLDALVSAVSRLSGPDARLEAIAHAMRAEIHGLRRALTPSRLDPGRWVGTRARTTREALALLNDIGNYYDAVLEAVAEAKGPGGAPTSGCRGLAALAGATIAHP